MRLKIYIEPAMLSGQNREVEITDCDLYPDARDGIEPREQLLRWRDDSFEPVFRWILVCRPPWPNRNLNRDGETGKIFELVESAKEITDEAARSWFAKMKLPCPPELPRLPNLGDKALEVSQYIADHPGTKGDKIASDLDMHPGHFRRLAAQLKAAGLIDSARRGYYPPSTKL